MRYSSTSGRCLTPWRVLPLRVSHVMVKGRIPVYPHVAKAARTPHICGKRRNAILEIRAIEIDIDHSFPILLVEFKYLVVQIVLKGEHEIERSKF